MIPATQEQIEAACMTRSAEDARTYLATIGLSAGIDQCRKTISAMLAEGKRGTLRDGPIEVAASVSINAASCQALLKRHLATGKHWISDPARMASALREAGMVRA
jgi:hypothetical protein